MRNNQLSKGYTSTFYNLILKFYFRYEVRNKKFCIISNDCWGAEIYKFLNRPFNTPFIGLMLMSPCYLKLLENPKYYLGLPLVFKKCSKYPSLQRINAGINFPVAVLGDTDIEIHFLHYTAIEIAKEKWDRRVKRIDWNNLFVKYDCGKDYADKEAVEKFIDFPFSNKIVFGMEDFGKNEVWVLEKYSLDAVNQFKNCFLNFRPIGWLKGETCYKNRLQKIIGQLAFKYL